MPSPPPTLYLAYGSNLSLSQMRARCPNSTYRGIARLRAYKWIINTRGYANVVEVASPPSAHTTPNANPNKTTVYGLVFALSPTDEAALDVYEGVPTAYTKARLACAFWPGSVDAATDTTRAPAEERREMLVYVDRLRTGEGAPRDEYVGRMNRGVEDAVRLGVPGGWVEEVVRGFVPADRGGRDG